jgi:hypothetical protein
MPFLSENERKDGFVRLRLLFAGPAPIALAAVVIRSWMQLMSRFVDRRYDQQPVSLRGAASLKERAIN